MALLPDLTPWLSDERGFVYDWTVQGDELRLTTAFANVGEGDLEIRGGDTHDGVQDVYQRIFNEDGTYTDRLAGEFQHHEQHGHIHFEDFAEFRLREVNADGSVGDIIADGDKVSFCLIDVARYDGDADASVYRSCGQVQGISTGWADVYSQGLPGQSIDITGVPDGSYFLEVVVDPDNNLVESDETNNVARILIELDRDGDGPEGNPDLFESNNSFLEASILAPPEDHLYENLSIDVASDVDFYRVSASETGEISFDIDFSHNDGDLDMRVYDENQNRIGTSQSVSDGESLAFDAEAGDQFYIEVYGYNGATNSNYSLFVDQPVHDHNNHDHGDEFEENDSFETATVLTATEDRTYDGLSIHEAGNADYYRVTATNSGTLALGLQFLHEGGDVDMRVYDADRNLLQTAQSTSDNESISVEAEAGDEFYINVYGYNGATNDDYSLSVDQAEPTDPEPPVEGNVYYDDPNENQRIYGDPEETDTFVIAGNSGDYRIGETRDGTGNVVWNENGFDLLFDVDAIQYDDQTVALTTEEEGVHYNIVGVTQSLTGTTDNDVFVVDAESSDFRWGPTRDGTGIVIWNEDGFDLLFGFEAIQFTDTTISLTDDEEPTTGLVVQNDPNQYQSLYGTDEVDRFVIDANAADYRWGPTQDGTGVVVWQGENFDILRDFEEIEFNDTVVDLVV